MVFDPVHPYSRGLMRSILVPEEGTRDVKLTAIPGTPPNMIYPPKGDACAARNKYAMKIDFEQEPPMFRITDTHYAATWLLHPKADASNIEMPAVLKERIERMRRSGAING